MLRRGGGRRVNLFPPCQDCGSFGMPADLSHGDETTFRCLRCALVYYGQVRPDIVPELVEVSDYVVLLRQDPTSRSYWGVPA